MGDLNSRVSRKPDFIPNDKDTQIFDNQFYEADQTDLGRCSQDTSSNTQGTKLLEFCIGNKMRILNGRTLGDLEGKFTCHRPTGSSVVDLAIVNETFMQHINVFKIHGYNGQLSDHCKISTKIKGDPPLLETGCQNNSSANNVKNAVGYVGYKWGSAVNLMLLDF